MKKIFVCLLAFLLLFVLSGCNTAGSSVKIKDDVSSEELKDIIYVGRVYGDCLYTFQDPKTGVWYYFGNSSGITPRLNSDGSPYTGD